MTLFFGYVKVLACFHYVFLYVSSQGGGAGGNMGQKEVVEAGGTKKYRVGEVEIVSKTHIFFCCGKMW